MSNLRKLVPKKKKSALLKSICEKINMTDKPIKFSEEDSTISILDSTSSDIKIRDYDFSDLFVISLTTPGFETFCMFY